MPVTHRSSFRIDLLGSFASGDRIPTKCNPIPISAENIVIISSEPIPVSQDRARLAQNYWVDSHPGTNTIPPTNNPRLASLGKKASCRECAPSCNTATNYAPAGKSNSRPLHAPRLAESPGTWPCSAPVRKGLGGTGRRAQPETEQAVEPTEACWSPPGPLL